MNKQLYFICLILFCVFTLSAGVPLSEKKPVTDTIFGKVLCDDYRYLENFDDSLTIDWIERQNVYEEEYFKNSKNLSKIEKRLSQLWRYDYTSLPERAIDGEYEFYNQKKRELEKRIYLYKTNGKAKGKVILDPNKWNADEDIEYLQPSFDGSLVAYGVSKGGNENPILKIMDVKSGTLLSDSVKGQKQYINCWLKDNSGFYYSANPIAGEVEEGGEYYYNSLYFHKIGTPADDDKKIFYSDSVKEYFHGADITDDGKYLFLYRWGFDVNQVYSIEIGTNDTLTISDDFDALYLCAYADGKIYIQTNKNAPYGKIYITDAKHPQKENWRVFAEEKIGYSVTSFSLIAGSVFITYQNKAHDIIYMYDLNGGFIREVKLPDIGSAYIWGRWKDDYAKIYFTSFVHPATYYKYVLKKDKLSVLKEYPVKVNLKDIATKQVFYNSKDGTEISMFIVANKKAKNDSSNITMLSGYGGFNISNTPYFSATDLIWIENGGIVAIPNLRGGGEYGEDWHRAGMLEKKQNVFDDFISAAEYLIDKGYTNPKKLVISGASNGGLLVGAVLVLRPELFAAVDCGVPLLDMIRYHKFSIANIWSSEYGSADDSTQFEYLLKYSPYQNVKSGISYPSCIISAGENDARVHPMHAFKMTAKLQNMSTGPNPIILLYNKKSGHGGGTTVTEQISQSAKGLDFLLNAVK